MAFDVSPLAVQCFALQTGLYILSNVFMRQTVEFPYLFANGDEQVPRIDRQLNTKSDS